MILRYKTKILTREQAYDFEMRRQMGETIKSILIDADLVGSSEYSTARADMKRYEREVKNHLWADELVKEVRGGS